MVNHDFEACPALVKSQEDKKEYRHITLSNGLVAMLVYDPEITSNSAMDTHGGAQDENGEEHSDADDGVHDEDLEEEEEEEEEEEGTAKGKEATKEKASAALCVSFGSFSDPPKMEGLAHYLEHMLFMGSEKFPDENAYDDFLTKHGGGSNAFTDAEQTCFYFDVHFKQLYGALDRFSQFFIAPLLRPDALQREVEAVQSEFVQAKMSDRNRVQQLQCATAAENHPYSIFSWGNKASLCELPKSEGLDVRARLVEDYKKHYYGARMTLVVVGGNTLDELEGMVRELFAAVPDKGLPEPSFESCGPPFEGGKIYYIKGVKDMQVLFMTWQLPCLKKDYHKKADVYLQHLVGHEGRGSLLSALKARGWASELCAGVGDGGHERNTCCYIFQVEVVLTKAGYARVKDVCGLVFQYMKLLREAKPQRWVFDELKLMAEMEFRFQEEEEAEDLAVRLATSMPWFKAEHALVGEYLYTEWDESAIAALLALLTPSNARIDVQAKEDPPAETNPRTEKWFGILYGVESVSDEQTRQWAQESPAADLGFPPHNDYIPSNFSLQEAPSIPANARRAQPSVVFEDSFIKLWHQGDATFRTPRAVMYIAFCAPKAFSSVHASILQEVFVGLVKDALNEEQYMASTAKLESFLSIANDRIEVKLSGFNQKMPLLLHRLLEGLLTLKVKEERFNDVRETALQKRKNALLKPTVHATHSRLRLLSEQCWDPDEKLASLECLQYPEVEDFAMDLFRDLRVEAFVHGNLSRQEALDVCNDIKSKFASASAEGVPMRPPQQIMKLPQGILFYRAPVKNPSEENSVVEFYFQIGIATTEAHILTDLIDRAMYEPLFDQLRTKQQLGYVVNCGLRLTSNVLGFAIVVQSATYSPKVLLERICAFLTYFGEQLHAMPADVFEGHRESLIGDKLQKETALSEESSHKWDQIYKGEYKFDHLEGEAEALRTATHEQMCAHFDRYIGQGAADRHALCVQIFGCKCLAEMEELRPS
eukprot:scaffold1697_cov363-Prasinococcus_capsulatus_cf.AAC.1